MLAERPNDPVLWFDLGLAYKRLKDWSSCVEANSKALEISQSAGDPAWWNLGIAATALRNWDLARKAWRGYGLEIDDGPGPVVCDYGSTPVRLPNDEIVWGPRIDPARVIVRNIPFPESGFRWGDIVLHDGAPNGEREMNGTVYSVFDVLERWSPSEIPTLGVDVHCDSIEDSKDLIRAFESHDFGAEDWSTNVRYICKDCSEGRPGHNHVPRDPGPKRSFALASPMGAALQFLQEWCAASPHSRRFSKPVPIG